MNITCPSFLHHPLTPPPALGFTSASLIRSALFLVLSECWALCCKAYCCLKLSSEISNWFFRHVAHPEEPALSQLPCMVHGDSQPPPTPPPLLLFQIISNDREIGVKSKRFSFVVYNKFLLVVICHTNNARRISQKIRAKRPLLLKEIGKDTSLLHSGLPWENVSLSSGTDLSMHHGVHPFSHLCAPHSKVVPLQGAHKALFLSHVFPSLSAAFPFIFESLLIFLPSQH